jgi:hypothetical protein
VAFVCASCLSRAGSAQPAPVRMTTIGGAKGPDFWCAFEDGEVVVIGDKPENTIKDRRRPRLLCRGTKES